MRGERFCCLRNACDCFQREARAPLGRSARSHHAADTDATPLEIRVFVDAASLEAFVDGGRTVFTELLLPTRRFDRAALVGRGFRLFLVLAKHILG